ncbi:hypothetical protein MKW94_027464 [Papaver nudicaule]|uniref:ATP-dependent DNA helicase n=1 Tax=Papaver nudicaule TaxID=74823 RepID=A0AA42B5E7_PAPNU|nr:hypothetical protein [Papaver nudicaule]
MRHTQCGNYCLRISKTTKQQVCRFKFPRDLSNESKLVEEPPNSNLYRFVGERNDELVNSHNRSVDEAKGNFLTWSECYAQLSHADENLPTNVDIAEDEFEEEIDFEDETQEEWMIASEMAPNFGPVEDTNLGLRSLDVDHDWSEGILRHPSIESHRNFTHTLGKAPQEGRSSASPYTSVTILSKQQQAALDLVLHSLRARSCIRLIISGGAGTGKSTLINAIVCSTRAMFGNDKAVRVMAPTGVAAYNIGGATVHHELAITADRNQQYKKLETERCGRMQVNETHFD